MKINITYDDSDIEDSVDELLQQYINLTDEMKLLENKQFKIKNKIIRLVNGQDYMSSQAIIRKIVNKGKIDFYKIPYLREVDLEEYRKPSREYFQITKKY